MAQLTEELAREHTMIKATIDQARELALNTHAGAELIFANRTLILGYLQKGDTAFYPVLRNAAQTNEQLKFLLELYGATPQATTQAANDFFSKYTSDGPSRHEDFTFAMDFARLSGLLELRIRYEESSLFPEYNKMHG